MIERKRNLARGREALKPQPLAPDAPGKVHALPQPPVAGAPQGLPPAGNDFNDWVALFAKNAFELKADFQLLNSANEMRQALVRLRAAEGWKRAACHSGPLIDAICPMMDIPLLRTDQPYDVHALEACDVGISECDALIAQTGSVLVTSRITGGPRIVHAAAASRRAGRARTVASRPSRRV
jgi:L-lactate dehydrogenase complex protein LldG